MSPDHPNSLLIWLQAGTIFICGVRCYFDMCSAHQRFLRQKKRNQTSPHLQREIRLRFFRRQSRHF